MSRQRPRPEVTSALDVETVPGCCMACDRPLEGRRRRLCGSEDCQRVYNTLHKMLSRALAEQHVADMSAPALVENDADRAALDEFNAWAGLTERGT